MKKLRHKVKEKIDKGINLLYPKISNTINLLRPKPPFDKVALLLLLVLLPVLLIGLDQRTQRATNARLTQQTSPEILIQFNKESLIFDFFAEGDGVTLGKTENLIKASDTKGNSTEITFVETRSGNIGKGTSNLTMTSLRRNGQNAPIQMTSLFTSWSRSSYGELEYLSQTFSISDTESIGATYDLAEGKETLIEIRKDGSRTKEYYQGIKLLQMRSSPGGFTISF